MTFLRNLGKYRIDFKNNVGKLMVIVVGDIVGGILGSYP